MSEEEIETSTESYGLLDSDAVLVSHYLSMVDKDEARRYAVLDLIVSFKPLDKEALTLARQIENYLLGKGPRAVGND